MANGEEALAAALSDPPELNLSDVMMPVMDGFGLLRELRKVETRTIPVILLSARAGEESRVEGLKAERTTISSSLLPPANCSRASGAHLSMRQGRGSGGGAEREPGDPAEFL